ncbi:MAG: 3-keto-5-aminohexanoate cleavage protein [Acidimicrobiales bacterium]|nr:3-keto-5-aminohexanoate cleavage protein [Acidimicrobiales bacterium]
MEPLIIEVAVNGVTRKERNPAAPESPEEIAGEALACLNAGATVIHTHPSRPPGAATSVADTAEDYATAYRLVLAERPDAILYPTMSGGADIHERYDHHRILADEGLIRCGVLDPGSANLASFGADGLPTPTDFVYTNSPNDIRYMMAMCAELALGPSFAIYEPGFLRMVLGFHAGGTLAPGCLVKFYFSGGGFFASGLPTFSAPPIPEALAMYRAMMDGVDLPWAVTVLGGDLLSTPLARTAVAEGGHLRIGLEDHPSAESNMAQLQRALDLAAEVGRPVAATAEAARILGLPRPPG